MSDVFDFQGAGKALQSFQLDKLFIEYLGWENPHDSQQKEYQCGESGESGNTYLYREIAALGEIPAFEIRSANGNLPQSDSDIREVYKHINFSKIELLLIFTNDESRHTRGSIWLWVKHSEGNGEVFRRHSFYSYQSGHELLNKLSRLFVSYKELDAWDRPESSKSAFVHRLRKLSDAFDVEKVTREFYDKFKMIHDAFVDNIEGIDNEHDRRWYASVLLNRIMFIYFLQRRHFMGNDEPDYLRQRFVQHSRNKDKQQSFYKTFLRPLFFIGLALKQGYKQLDGAVFGQVPYLNGGLFLQHEIEERYGDKINVADSLFEELFKILDTYEWTLNDDAGSDGRTISPAILGYIFEKYINQKQFGAYYTRPEITTYLCEQCIHAAVMDKLRALDLKDCDGERINLDQLSIKSTLPETLMHMNVETALLLDKKVLPNLSVLDPACGSGAFLIAAMKTLEGVYRAAWRTIYAAGSGKSNDPLAHKAVNFLKDLLIELKVKGSLPEDAVVENINSDYLIKKRIIIDNLYGVDIMDEAIEIARLRLFLDLIAVAAPGTAIEALPNVDFNILAGNSLIGLLNIQPEKIQERNSSGNAELANLEEPLREYHRLRDQYKQSLEDEFPLVELRNKAHEYRRTAMELLNGGMLREFADLKISYEREQWDTHKNKAGKRLKRPVNVADLDNLRPLHWGIDFQKIMECSQPESDNSDLRQLPTVEEREKIRAERKQRRLAACRKEEGFDVILANPPWEAFKPQDKEFFAAHSELVKQGKKTMRIEDFLKRKKDLLKDDAIRTAYEDYMSQFPFMSKYFRSAHDYQHQSVEVNGRKTGSDINLYKLFVERCYNLLREDGHAGLVLPGGIYSDLGATGLRRLLLHRTRIKGLFGFENRKGIFEGVHRSFKFIVLTLQKGGETKDFPAAFMRHDVKELEASDSSSFPKLSPQFVEMFSRGTYSFPEIDTNSAPPILIKMHDHPRLDNEKVVNNRFVLTSEIHMTNDSTIFEIKESIDHLPLVEGKMIHQFSFTTSEQRYWIPTDKAKTKFSKRFLDNNSYPFEQFRIAIRDVARNTDSRTLIVTIIPKGTLAGNTLNVSQSLESFGQLYLTAILNSFALDYVIRLKVNAHCNMFYIYQLPVPRIDKNHWAFRPLVEGAARLICTSPEYDELAAEVGLGDHTHGAHDPAERAAIRARLDGIVAHLYNLNSEEFRYILTTFPIVDQQIKDDALAAFEALAANPEVLLLTDRGEGPDLEFKQMAWAAPARKGQSPKAGGLLEAIASFLNSYGGGTILLGVADDGTVTGLQEEYRAANPQKNNADGLMLSLSNSMKDSLSLAQPDDYVKVEIQTIHTHEVAVIRVAPGPEPVYVGNSDAFYVRGLAGKQELRGKERDEFTRRRFNSGA